jgi:hypothetical protein
MDSCIAILLDVILRRRKGVPNMTEKTTSNCHVKTTAEPLGGINKLEREAYQLEVDVQSVCTWIFYPRPCIEKRLIQK